MDDQISEDSGGDVSIELIDDYFIYKKCLGLTKANTRCNRKIKGNKYCYLHRDQENEQVIVKDEFKNLKPEELGEEVQNPIIF